VNRQTARTIAWALLCCASAATTLSAETTARWQAVERKGVLDIPSGTGLVEINLSALAEAVNSGKCRASGQMRGRLRDSGLEALVLLSYLGAGHTSKFGKYRTLVGKMHARLLKRQDETGCFSKDLLNQALACLAASELAGMDKKDAGAAQKGFDFLFRRQLPGGGLPAQAGGKKADDLASIFAVTLFKSAKMAGLKADGAYALKLHNWMRKRIDKRTGKALNTAGRPDMVTTAGVALGLLNFGAARNDPQVLKLVKAVAANLPTHRKPDFLYWNLGQMLCFRIGGEVWKKWNAAAKRATLEYAYARLADSDTVLPEEVGRRIPGIIKRMGDDSWLVRERASKEALSMPRSSVRLFRRHLKHGDPEVVVRVQAVIDSLLVRQTSDPYCLAAISLTLEVYYRYLPIHRLKWAKL
jgi:hypothetical protein